MDRFVHFLPYIDRLVCTIQSNQTLDASIKYAAYYYIVYSGQLEIRLSLYRNVIEIHVDKSLTCVARKYARLKPHVSNTYVHSIQMNICLIFELRKRLYTVRMCNFNKHTCTSYLHDNTSMCLYFPCLSQTNNI